MLLLLLLLLLLLSFSLQMVAGSSVFQEKIVYDDDNNWLLLRLLLVSNLVSPLLNRLNNLLDNRSLSNLSDRGQSIGSSLWEPKTRARDGYWSRSSSVAIAHCRYHCTTGSSNNTGENDQLIHDVIPTLDGLELPM